MQDFVNEKHIDKFKNTLHKRNWHDIKITEDPNKAYRYSLDILIDIYDEWFLKTEVKFKSDHSPWITKESLKNRTSKMKRHIKLMKNYLKPLKRDKKIVLFRTCGGGTRKTWSVMKEILGKCITKSLTLPTKINFNKTDIFNTKK